MAGADVVDCAGAVSRLSIWLAASADSLPERCRKLMFSVVPLSWSGFAESTFHETMSAVIFRYVQNSFSRFSSSCSVDDTGQQ